LVRLSLGLPIRALEDCQVAVLEPTPLRLLHLAVIEAANGNLAEARKALEEAKGKGLGNRWLSTPDQRRLAEVEALLAVPGAA